MHRSLSRLVPLVFAGLILGGSVAEAAVGSAERAGYRSAIRRGYSEAQARCFGGVFATYASLNRYGRWTAGGRKRSDIYRHEAWSRCGVMR